jgi:hypothetical protein
MSLKPLVVLLGTLLISACSTQILRQSELNSGYLNAAGELAECASLFADVDESILEAGVSDAQTGRVAGFPYLRTNRLFMTFNQQLSAGMVPAWLGQMRKLDQEARHYELQNAFSQSIERGVEAKLNTCAEILLRADLQDPGQIEKIKKAALVPDSYIWERRTLGLYTVSRLFVINGVKRLQKRIKAGFSQSSDALVTKGNIIAYTPEQSFALSDEMIAQLINASNGNALSLPLFKKQDREKLFNHFAPVWELDVVDDNDIIGAPIWSDENEILIRKNEPRVYRHLSYVRVKGQILPQFNYVVWFSSRPPSSAYDILSGKLDGITWRVTVGLDGKVLIYDVMHNCGCYHMFFPMAATEIRTPDNNEMEEPVLVPQRAPILQQEQRIHVRIASGSHYVEALWAAVPKKNSEFYSFADYNELRSLSMKNGKRKSLFGISGIVPGTNRRERWLLWPMGVENAGAMRQWGNHATAFVGRRHFDDADLFERYFHFR